MRIAGKRSGAQYRDAVYSSLQGFDATGQGFSIAGSFTPGGDGTIARAEADYNGYVLAAGARGGARALLGRYCRSGYALRYDGRGCLVLSFTDSLKLRQPTEIFQARGQEAVGSRRRSRSAEPARDRVSIWLGAKNASGVYGNGRIIEFDDLLGSGSVASGVMHLQDPTSFSLTALGSNYAFGLTTGGLSERVSIAGMFTNVAAAFWRGCQRKRISTLSPKSMNHQDGGAEPSTPHFQPTVVKQCGYVFDGPNNGSTYHFAIYMANASDCFMISTDQPRFRRRSEWETFRW